MSTDTSKFNDVWRSERTCEDDMHCPGETSVCRDGTYKNFMGLPSPVCVSICDRRIFDTCTKHEACRVQHQKAVCVDPCDEKSCNEGEVCEVHASDEVVKGKTYKEATPYCLACGDKKTSMQCGTLRQCKWSTDDEVCQMRCTVVKSKKKCHSSTKDITM